MSIYQSKSVQVNAEPYKFGMEDGFVRWNEFIPANGERYTGEYRSKKYPRYHVRHDYILDEFFNDETSYWTPYITVNQCGYAISPTDMIVTNADGKRYVMNKEEFDKLYDAVDEPLPVPTSNTLYSADILQTMENFYYTNYIEGCDSREVSLETDSFFIMISKNESVNFDHTCLNFIIKYINNDEKPVDIFTFVFHEWEFIQNMVRNGKSMTYYDYIDLINILKLTDYKI